MAKLDAAKIEKLASRKGVKRVAVENFLGTMDGSNKSDAWWNLRADAKSYGWNDATVKAISDGIASAI